MLDQFPKFDMKMKPKRPKLRLLSYLIALPPVLSHKAKLRKTNMKGIKPPYILLGNHNAFMDINVLSVITFPHLLNYVIAIDGFLHREALLRHIGGICKRKFTQDYELINHIAYALDHKRVVAIFPEARYSLCGTKAIIPTSVARMCKHFKVPVVMLKMHGNHINSPFWNLTDRKVKGIEGELFPLIRPEEVDGLSTAEINERIQKNFEYDEYAWQKENNIRVTYKGRAEGLHKVLYKCPHCGEEYQMSSKGIHLHCEACGKTWEYSELGELKALEGETEFPHIPDWYEWEREEVRKEVEAGTYRFESPVHVDLLPKDCFHPLGKAYLVHDMEGFHLKGRYKDEEYEVEIAANTSYGVHIEYEYLGKYGDCVDLNTIDNTYYVYPECERFSVTKISLATEELFKKYEAERQNKLAPQ